MANKATYYLKRTICLVLFILLLALRNYAQTEYINPDYDQQVYGISDGTIDHPWTSFPSSFSSSTIYKIAEGKTIVLNQKLNITSNNNNIQIDSYDLDDDGEINAKPVIKQSSSFQDDYLISIYGTNNKLHDLKLISDDNQGTIPASCIEVIGNGNEINSCEFVDFENYGIKCLNNYNNGSEITVKRCKFLSDVDNANNHPIGIWSDFINNSISFNIIIDAYEALIISSPSSGTSLISANIFNNIFWNCDDCCFEVLYANINTINLYNNIFDSDSYLFYIDMVSCPGNCYLNIHNNCYNNYTTYNSGGTDIYDLNYDFTTNNFSIGFIDVTNYDFHLTDNSPLINAGSDNILNYSSSTILDFDGNVVPYSNSKPDVGVYETNTEMSYYINPDAQNPAGENGTIILPFNELPASQESFVTYRYKRGTTSILSSDLTINTNDICLSSYGTGATPVIDFNQTASTINTNGKSNITIEDLDIKNSSSACISLFGFPTHDITIQDCEIHNSSKGILLQNSIPANGEITNVSINNCVIHDIVNEGISCEYTDDITIKESEIYSATNAFYINNCNNVGIGKNSVYNCTSNSIKIQNSDEIAIAENDLYFTSSVSGIYFPQPSTNVSIQYNELHSDPTAISKFIELINCDADINNNKILLNNYSTGIYSKPNSSDSHIYNNYFDGGDVGLHIEKYVNNSSLVIHVHNNIFSGQLTYSIETHPEVNTQIINNDFISQTSSSGYHISVSNPTLWNTAYPGTINIFNNIFFINQSSFKIFNIPDYVKTDYNAFDSELTNFIIFGSGSFNNLASYSSSSSNGQNSIVLSNASSCFVDLTNNNLTLAPSSECINAGTSTNYSFDYFGNPTPFSNTDTDIGAIEYIESVQVDWKTKTLQGWYLATDEIVSFNHFLKRGNIYHGTELVNIRGINWQGIGIYQNPNLGLSDADYVDLLNTIKNAGFNTIRFVINGSVFYNKFISNNENYVTEGIATWYTNNLADLYGKTEFEVFEKIVQKCKELGLYILIDFHTMDYDNNLWYNTLDPESKQKYLSSLESAADYFYNTTFVSNGQTQTYDNIIGIDLINEPYSSIWKDNDDVNEVNIPNNFKQFSEIAGNLILSKNPDWLIFVEGIQYHDIQSLKDQENQLNPNLPNTPANEYNWGESLSALSLYPVNESFIPKEKLVLSPHSYQYKLGFVQYYMNQTSDIETLTENIGTFNDFRWGFLAKNEGNAVIPGEFGLDLNNNDCIEWFPAFIRYMAELKLPGSFYWSLNKNDSYYPLLTGTHWTDLIQAKYKQLIVMYGVVEATDPSVPNEPYSPRDFTNYDFSTAGLPAGATVKHVASWAGENLMSADFNDGMEQTANLYSILHEFEVSCTQSGNPVSSSTNNFTITVEYTDDELGRVVESSLGFYKYNPSTQQWEQPQNNFIVTTDPTNNLITLTTNNFGIYAVFGDKMWQKTDLPEGWILWSTYIAPEYPNVEDVFSDVITIGSSDDLEIMKDEAGLTFWPEYGINQIGNLSAGEGYQIKMNNANSIQVYGTKLMPENTQINVPQGWSIIAYLRQIPGNAEDMFNSVVQYIDIVKNGNGDVYWPAWSVNDIGNMYPSEGYQINANTAITYYYPDDGVPDMFKNGNNQSNTSFANIFKNYTQDLYINTDNFMVVGIPYSSWGTPPQPGDEIAALGEQGQLVGKTIFEGGFTALTIYGDDQYTPNIVENLSDGESFSFEVWSAQNKTTTGYQFKNWAKGNGSFQSQAVDVVTETLETQDMEALTLDLYPNPGMGEFFLSISSNENESVNLAVYDLQGQKLYTQTIDLLKGKQDILLNLTGLEPGIYTLKLFSEKINEQKQLIIVK